MRDPSQKLFADQIEGTGIVRVNPTRHHPRSRNRKLKTRARRRTRMGKMNILQKIKARFTDKEKSEHLRHGDCLVFAEVKTRSSEDWSRPAAAVNAERRRRLSQCALDYLRLLRNPPVKIRFDIVEVLLDDGKVSEIRHLPNTFAMSKPFR